MRTLRKNARPIYYAPLISERNAVDEKGHITSEKVRVYGEQSQARVNYSSERGENVTALFGETKDYDLVITSTRNGLPIDESAILWVNAAPDKAHDYRVVRISDSLNVRTVLIRRVIDD